VNNTRQTPGYQNLKIQKLNNSYVLLRDDGTKYSTVKYKNSPEATNVKLIDGTSVRRAIEYLIKITFPETVPGKPIEGYPNHTITKNGEVYSLKTLKYLNPIIGKNGYKVVNITSIDGNKVLEYIHRLVARAFVEGDQTLTVNHKDGDKLNNHYTNLEWISNEDNLKHAWETGLQDSRNKGCAVSKDGKEWKFFPRLIDAKELIEKELSITMANASKLGKAAKQNDTLDKNKGYDVTINPYRYRGYIVLNTIGEELPEKFKNIAMTIDNTLYSEGLERPVEVSKDKESWDRYDSGKKAAEAIGANRSKVTRAARDNEKLGFAKYRTAGYYIRYAS